MKKDQQLAEVFCLAVDLGLLLGVEDIKNLPGAWVCKVDSRWTFAINGKDETVEVDLGRESMGIEKLERFHMAIWFNGWLAGLLTPLAGSIFAGTAGDEENFIKALNERIGTETLAKEFGQA